MSIKKSEKALLLVDPDMPRRNNLSSRFRTQNFSVEAGTNGFHTLSLLEQQSYSAILVVDGMPDMPADEIISLSREANKDIPILYFAKSLKEEDLIKRCLEAGANSFLLRDANFNQILVKVEHLLKTSTAPRKKSKIPKE